MLDKTNSRRKLLKSITAGTGAVVAGKAMPESWSKPVIDAVILPVHATMTDDTSSGDVEVTTTIAATTPPACDTGWINGDSPGDDEEFLGYTDTRCECEALVKAQAPKADGATWGFSSPVGERSCYAEYGWTSPAGPSDSWETKSFNQ